MIVLFTDFGVTGPYVGQVTAVLKRKAPGVDVVNLFADAPACNPKAAAYLLAAYVDEFPAGTVFLCVVDPGVGGARAAGILQADGRWYVGPDNGLFELVRRRAGVPGRWWRIVDPRGTVSATFHGRDIFAPAAATIALGAPPDGVEEPVASIARPAWPDDLEEVVYIDGLGNAMTGVRAAGVSDNTTVRLGRVQLDRARTFSDVAPGKPFWFANANGLVEISVNGGRAETVLGLKIGMPIEISAL